MQKKLFSFSFEDRCNFNDVFHIEFIIVRTKKSNNSSYQVLCHIIIVSSANLTNLSFFIDQSNLISNFGSIYLRMDFNSEMYPNNVCFFETEIVSKV